MAEDKPFTNPPTPPATPDPGTGPIQLAPQACPTINIGDEFGTAKRNLPPPKVLGIGLALILLISAIIVFMESRPSSSGSIEDVNAVDIAGQISVLATINVTSQKN